MVRAGGQLVEDEAKEKALYTRLRHLHSVGKRKSMQGSEQEKHIKTPAMLQDSSSGSGLGVERPVRKLLHMSG